MIFTRERLCYCRAGFQAEDENACFCEILLSWYLYSFSTVLSVLICVCIMCSLPVFPVRLLRYSVDLMPAILASVVLLRMWGWKSCHAYFRDFLKSVGFLNLIQRSCWPGVISIFELCMPCLSCRGVSHVVCFCFQAPKVSVYITTAQAFIVVGSKVEENCCTEVLLKQLCFRL